jgi:hypothetical protein
VHLAEVVALPVLADDHVSFALAGVQADAAVVARADPGAAGQAPQPGHPRYHDKPGMPDQLSFEFAQPEWVRDGRPQRPDLLDTAKDRLDRVAKPDRAVMGKAFDDEPRPRAERVRHAVFEENLAAGQPSAAPEVELYLAVGPDRDPVGKQLPAGADAQP